MRLRRAGGSIGRHWVTLRGIAVTQKAEECADARHPRKERSDAALLQPGRSRSVREHLLGNRIGPRLHAYRAPGERAGGVGRPRTGAHPARFADHAARRLPPPTAHIDRLPVPKSRRP